MQTIDLGYTPRPAFRPFHMRSQKRSCLVCHRRAGKTVALIADMVDSALRCSKPNGRFQLLAPLHKQVKDIAWTYLKDMTQAVPRRTINESELWVGLPSQAGTQARVPSPDAADALALTFFERLAPLGLASRDMSEDAEEMEDVWE